MQQMNDAQDIVFFFISESAEAFLPRGKYFEIRQQKFF
jgi:hypothetical protein